MSQKRLAESDRLNREAAKSDSAAKKAAGNGRVRLARNLQSHARELRRQADWEVNHAYLDD